MTEKPKESRPSFAPRITEDGRDLDAEAAEEARIKREAAQLKEISEQISGAVHAVLSVVQARRYAAEAVDLLDGLVALETPAEVKNAIENARAILIGAAERLNFELTEPGDDDDDKAE